MTDQEIIEIVQARIDRKEIQQISNSEWIPFDGMWKFYTISYRIKPREWWSAVFTGKYASISTICTTKEGATQYIENQKKFTNGEAIGELVKVYEVTGEYYDV